MAKFNRLNFRQNIIDSKYILLLPLIAAYELWKINRTSSLSNHESQLFNYYLLINACIVLLAYRFNVSLGSFTLFNAGLFVILYYQQTFSIPLFSISFLSFILLFNLITLKLLWILPVKYSRCFTFAEFAIVFQAIYYYVVSIYVFNWQYWIVNDGSSMMMVAQKFDAICLICYSTLAIHWMIAQFVSKLDPIIYLISLPLSLYVWLYHFLHIEPLYWFVTFFSSNQIRIYLLLFWFLVVLLTLTFVYIHTFLTVDRQTTTATRKIFHLAISIVYITGIKYDLLLLNFASKLILFIFIFIEIIRLSRIPVIVSIINTVFERFRDEKDSGILTLTHIYLLIGCSLPLWLCNDSTNHRLLLSSGILSIGIGDTIASIVGITFGSRRQRWPNSSKTYIGTFGFFLSHFLSFFLLDYYYYNNLFNTNQLQLVIKVLIISIITCLMETFTKHVDNLLLPLIEYFL
uniref:dolichol kinase n=1 Tax=Dermatophagoides pteronyssinus TaxID=6956 RepID=A0A6P6Y6K7_DERPT